MIAFNEVVLSLLQVRTCVARLANILCYNLNLTVVVIPSSFDICIMNSIKYCISFRRLSSRSNIMSISQKFLPFCSRGMKIYTKTGDKGLTSNYVGTRIPKDDVVVEALGSTDELSSHIGLARSWMCRRDNKTRTPEYQHLVNTLATVQCSLQDIGSHIATPLDSKQAQNIPMLQPELVKQLELQIDEMTSQLPPLKHFILPGGGVIAGHLHVARSVCRRSERTVVPLVRSGSVPDLVGVYLNRLSDFLFTSARWVAHTEGEEETIYRSVK